MFLRNPEQETGAIKALKHLLVHVRDQIRRDQVDATSELDRSTRPFTLRLKKTLASHERAVKRFANDLKRLRALPKP